MIKMKQYLEFRNISTILTSVFLTIFGLILGFCASKGLNLPITAESLTSIAIGIVFFAFSYYNAKHHNNFFDEETDTIYIPIDDLDDNQIKAINNFIEKAIETNLKHENEITDTDPAGEYENIGDE